MQQGHDNKTCTAALPSEDKARLVELCAAQLQAALDDARLEIDALSQAIVSTAQQVTALSHAATNAGASSAIAADTIARQSSAATAAVNGLFLRTQFGDRLTQRLTNVMTNLGHLAENVRAGEQFEAEQKWIELLGQIRASFTMESERELFDAAFTVAPDLAAAQICKYQENSQPDGRTMFDQEFKDD